MWHRKAGTDASGQPEQRFFSVGSGWNFTENYLLVLTDADVN